MAFCMVLLQLLIFQPPQTFGVSFLSLAYLSYGMNGYGMPNGKLLGRVRLNNQMKNLILKKSVSLYIS